MDLIAGELIYIIYMITVSVSFGLLCGAVAVIASYVFLSAIYSTAKVE